MPYLHLLFISLLFTQALLFSPFTLLSFELPKVLFLYLFSALIFAVALLQFRVKRLERVHWLFLILLIWILITSLAGLNFAQSFWGSYFRMQGILSWICYGLLFFVSGKIFEKDHFKIQASWAILISSVFVSILSITQFTMLWFLNDSAQLLYSGRVISTFGQPNFLGAYLVMSLPFAWFSFKQSKPSLPLQKSFATIAIILIVLGIFSTLSRSAYLGLAVLTLILGLKYYKALILSLFFSLLALFLLANIFPNLFSAQWLRIKVEIAPSWPLWTAENRIVIAQKSVDLIAQSPIFGYGLENFSSAFPKVVNPDDFGLKDIVVDSSHNLFLDLAANLGIIGLLIFVTPLAITFKKGLTVSSDHQDFVKTALYTALVFVIMHQFSPVSVVPLTLFWISLGIIHPIKLESVAYKGKLRALLLLFAVLINILTIFYIVQTLRADNLFRKASSYEVVDIHQAISSDNEAISIAPWIGFYKVRRDFLIKQLGY